MIPVFNESDIVGQVIDHAVSQGLELVIIDNGSTDGSYEICRKCVGKGVLELKRLPTTRFELTLLRNELHAMALRHHADWEVILDADEFLESPYRELTFREAVQLQDEKGYNLIQVNCFEFWPTEKDPRGVRNVRKRIRYYSWNDDMQFRCWKVMPELQLTEVSPHLPRFRVGGTLRVSPNRFVLRHYRFRSYEQGVKKVFRERLPRYSPEERKKGRSKQYDNFEPNRSYFVIDSGNLTKYKEDGNWNTLRNIGGPFEHWQPLSTYERIIQLENEVNQLKKNYERRRWFLRLRRGRKPS
jgi:glycosyltransferase involved in cell wall biosynthesis